MIDNGGVLMNYPNNQVGYTDPKEFWDSLHLDILTSNQNISQNDYRSFIERSFVFSMFFRGCHPLELRGFRRLLDLQEYGYCIILDLPELQQAGLNEETTDELEIYYFIHNLFTDHNQFPDHRLYIGPLFANRVCLLVTCAAPVPENHREESLALSLELQKELKQQFQINPSIAVGSLQSINAIYTSFIDALSALYFRRSEPIIYYQDKTLTASGMDFDYLLAEKYLLEAIRLRKTDSYDYFALIMDWVRNFCDDTKRDKILELLVLSSHSMRLDNQEEVPFISYTGVARELMELEGDALIECAYKNFMFLTSYVKPQSNIDYSNHIVQATKEYLETHYAEEITREDAAEQVNISPQYFSKLIKKTTGFNFIDWLSILRVKKAKELLTNSNLTVKEVCYMVGYKDPNYFSRIFKKRIGITPSEYVKTSSYFNNKS